MNATSNRQVSPSRYRRPVVNSISDRGFQQEGSQPLRSCDDFRRELLDSPITDIIVDISPEQPPSLDQRGTSGLNRTWTDCNGDSLVTGTLTGLEQSYIVVTEDSGQRVFVPITRLSDGDLSVVTEFWALPAECSLGCESFAGRHWSPSWMHWKASSLCHKPLYFENIQLERYGHSHGPIMQPLRSTAHFFTSVILLPYNTAIHPPNECQYALGYYRPGDCAPWLKDPFPISMHGTFRQAAVIGAGVAVLP